jgi:hypothetical protein
MITGWHETVRSRKGHYFRGDKSLCGQHRFAPCYSRSVQKPKCDTCNRELIRQEDAAEEKAVLNGELRICGIRYRKDCIQNPWSTNSKKTNYFKCFPSLAKAKAALRARLIEYGFKPVINTYKTRRHQSEIRDEKSDAMDKAIDFEDRLTVEAA